MTFDLKRRHLLQALAAAPVLAAPGLARAASAAAGPADSADSADNWMLQFQATQRDVDWSLGYVTPNDNLKASAISVRGRFPVAVQGTLYRNGPAQHDLGGLRYHHWFDGDGMLQRFSIGSDFVDHFGKYIATDKFVAERRVGHRLVEAFGTKLPDLIAVNSGDSLNVANTSVLPFHGQLLALWEGGSAVKVDATTLEASGVQTWRDDLASLPFSAHPRVEPDGTIWNFGVGSGKGLLIVYQIGADGQLRRAEAIKVADVPMIHDFVVTRSKLVFLMPPLVFDAERFSTNSFLDSHVWRQNLPMRVLVVDKSDFTQHRIYELDAAFLFHLGNAWEDSNGVIRLDYIHSDRPDSLFISTREVMRGRYPESEQPRLATVVIDPRSGVASRQVLPIDGEFPRIDARLTGLRYRNVIHATGLMAGRPGFTAIASTNIESARSERFVYGADHLVEEHIFIADGERPGWILGTSLDLTRSKTQLACFAADRLQDGPVALAELPYALPLGLHGNFVRAT
jgi:all-trans-8'-apo-beta-carotenal 15,15'-oxygenase